MLVEHQGYPWKANSCWLDVSLESLFTAVLHDYEDFCTTLDDLPLDALIFPLVSHFQERHDRQQQPINQHSFAEWLSEKRDRFRSYLADTLPRGALIRDEPEDQALDVLSAMGWPMVRVN